MAHPDREQDVHIGLLALGWVFQFQGKHAKTVAEWETRLENLPGEYAIINEYGMVIDRADFWRTVRGTKIPGVRNVRPTTDRPGWNDEGFDFCNYEFS